MFNEWSNWSGSLRFSPERIVAPGDEEELANLVDQCAESGQPLRVVGAGHSSSPLVATDDVLVTLERLACLESHDAAAREAIAGAGMPIDEAGRHFQRLGLAFANLGDIDNQTVAGALATGTHGSGMSLPNLSVHLIGGRLVTGSGEVVTFGVDEDPEILQAHRVSLGVMGILTALRLRLVPAHRLHRRIWCAQIDDCLEDFPALAAAHRHVDFYWYPRSDEAKIRIADFAESPREDLPYARLLAEQTGWSNEIIPRNRALRFEEMEYALPAEHGLACFREVRQRVKERWRHIVGWRVLYRTVAADDAWLSNAHGRPTVTISLHQNATLPYRAYFADIEPIFRAYGGRPHWGKKHSLAAHDLRPLYPMWDHFLEARRAIDPAGVLLSAPMRELLGVS